MASRNIAVIGAGSAGLVTAGMLLSHTSSDTKVTLISDPSIPIIGVGESVAPILPDQLKHSIDFVPFFDIPKLKGTVKWGTMYTNWRDKEAFITFPSALSAMHFDTYEFNKFMVPRLREKWGDRFVEVDGNVESLTDKGPHVEVLYQTTCHIEYYDYVVDCMGFPQSFDDYNMVANPVNHCLVHDKMEGGDWGYTDHVATENGWMFVIPLADRQSYGYLYDDNITSWEDAKADFSRLIGVDELNLREFKFKSYYTKKFCEGRIFKNGNKSSFFEPQLANSLTTYSKLNLLAIKYIEGRMTLGELNDKAESIFLESLNMISFCYHGGSTYDTPFWKQAMDIANDHLDRSDLITEFYKKWERYKLDDIPYSQRDMGFEYHPVQITQFDKEFGYGYFEE